MLPKRRFVMVERGLMNSEALFVFPRLLRIIRSKRRPGQDQLLSPDSHLYENTFRHRQAPERVGSGAAAVRGCVHLLLECNF